MRSLLDEKLLRTIPLVNEANAYADEMTRGVVFTVKLMSNPGKKAHWASKKSEDGDEGEVFVLDTDVYVRVDSTDHTEPQRFWIYDKFMDRLYSMREMYQVCVTCFSAFLISAHNPISGRE